MTPSLTSNAFLTALNSRRQSYSRFVRPSSGCLRPADVRRLSGVRQATFASKGRKDRLLRRFGPQRDNRNRLFREQWLPFMPSWREPVSNHGIITDLVKLLPCLFLVRSLYSTLSALGRLRQASKTGIRSGSIHGNVRISSTLLIIYIRKDEVALQLG